MIFGRIRRASRQESGSHRGKGLTLKRRRNECIGKTEQRGGAVREGNTHTEDQRDSLADTRWPLYSVATFRHGQKITGERQGIFQKCSRKGDEPRRKKSRRGFVEEEDVMARIHDM